MTKRGNKYIIYSVILLLVIGLSVGFSAFQKQLLIDDSIFEVRIHEDVRVSNSALQKVSGSAVSNFEDFNKNKVLGNISFENTSDYVLYKVDLTNYGNIKSGLLNISTNSSGINYSICDSTGSNCSSDFETPICEGANCTLGSTKEIYLKITSNTTGTKNVDLDLEFEPYNNITYTNVLESMSGFRNEIMTHDTYSITFTSKPEQVDISGTVTYTYNKTTGVLSITDVESDINIHAKYLSTDIAESSYTGSNPDNYVRFNNNLFRIITKENIDDGYGNEELRTMIISNSSIGDYAYDTSLYHFENSSISEYLNETYFNNLGDDKDYIDSVLWHDNYQGNKSVYNVLILNENYYSLISPWFNKNQFLSRDPYAADLVGENENDVPAINNGTLTYLPPNTIMPTYPTMYLTAGVLISGGTGTQTDPYTLELPNDGLQSNPTVVRGRTLTVTGSNQELVTVTSQVGTVYYSLDTTLNSSNYTEGTTTIPADKNVGSYTISYYIPAGSGYKAKSGVVTTRINGLTYTITYQKGENVTSIGKTTDTCTTTGTASSCSVTLPTITPASGYENGKWYNGSNSYNAGSSYTLSSNGTVLTAQVTGKTYTANVYYYNGTQIANTSVSCQVVSGSTCVITLPSAVTNSKGIYNSTFKGIANNTNTVNTVSLQLSDSGTYYAVYSENVTNYYYNINAYAQRTLYRNEFFTSASAMTSILSTEATGVTNYSTAAGPGNSAWTGLSTAQDTTIEYNNVASAAASTSKTLYTVYTFNVNYQIGANVSAIGKAIDSCNVTTSDVSCKVILPTITPNAGNESVGWNDTNGATTGTSAGSEYTLNTNPTTLYANAKGATYTATFYYFDGALINSETNTCTVTSGSTCTVSVPVAVSSSHGQYNSTFAHVADTVGTMAVGNLTLSDNTKKFYATYTSNVNLTYYLSGTGEAETTRHRNEFFTADDAMDSVISDTTSGTINYVIGNGAGNSTFAGFSIDVSTTVAYSTVALAANSTSNTLYAVYQFTINYQAGDHVAAIGATSATCNIKSSETSCSVILPTITPENGYVSAGWSTTNGASTGEAPLSLYTLNSNGTTLYANTIGANYENTTTHVQYSKLNDAFAEVDADETIKALNSVTETVRPVLSSGKIGIKLDLNGKTITLTHSNSGMSVIGSLDIYSSNGNATIQGESAQVIYANGNLTINGTSHTNRVTIKSTSPTGKAIYVEASKTTTLNENTYLVFEDAGNSVRYLVNNYGLLNINGAVLDSNLANNGGVILYGAPAKVVVNSGSIQTTEHAIRNYSSEVINDPAIEINGGTFSSTNANTINNVQPAKVVITNGTINGSKVGVYSSGVVNISGGTFETTNSCVYNTSGTVTITGGTFTGSVGSTAITNNTGTVTINNGTFTSRENIIINRDSGTINIAGGSFTTTNTDYSAVYNTLDGTINISDGDFLASAIAITNNTTGTVRVSGGTFNAEKNAINNHGTGTVTITGGTFNSLNDSYPAIANYDGNITIDDVIITGNAICVWNKQIGTITINGGIFTSNSNNVLNSDTGTITITGGTFNGLGSPSIVNHTGNITIDDATITSNSSGVWNVETGTITINGGTIISSTVGVDNDSTGNVNITGGSITGVNAIRNDGLGTLNISGGTITSSLYSGVLNQGTAVITGGTIIGKTYGVYSNENTSLTIGSNDGNINNTVPLIQSVDTTGGYGIYVFTNATFNFYDGLVKSEAGSGYSVRGTPNTPTGYGLEFELNNGIESAYLIRQSYLMGGSSDDWYSNYLRTNTPKHLVETINFVNGLNNHTINNTDCFDVSRDEDGSVLAWVTDLDNDEYFEINIGASGKLYASTGAHLFENLLNLEEINGFEYLDTSKVTDMNGMFYDCRLLESIDLSHFNTSKVTNMSYMFYNCESLTSINLSSFNTSNVTNMSNMFRACKGITSLDLTYTSFNTSKVTNMSYMFDECTNLSSLDLTHDNFNTSNVTNMSNMFFACAFTSLDLSHFDTSKVTSMSGMFEGCEDLTSLNISSFNTSEVVYMSRMFQNCSNLTSLNLSHFVTSNVTNMSFMFASCSKLTSLNISTFNTSKVTNMSYIFYECEVLQSLDLRHFDTANVTNMEFMFYKCKSMTNVYLEGWNTSKVTAMHSMFANCNELVTLDLSSFNTSLVTRMDYMFDYCFKLKTIYATNSFVTTAVTDSTYMFTNNYQLVGGNGTAYSGLNPIDKTYAHIDGGTANPGYFTLGSALMPGDTTNTFLRTSINKSDIESISFVNSTGNRTANAVTVFDVSTNQNGSVLAWYELNQNNKYDLYIGQDGGVIASSGKDLFNGLTNLTTISGLEYLNTTNVADMSSMFKNCSSLTNLVLTDLNTSNVSNMSDMFNGCSSLTNLNTSLFNTANVTNMSNMFKDCSSLTTINTSSFNTSNVTNMSGMFDGCANITSLNLSNFNTAKVTNMASMFNGDYKLASINLSSFNTSLVTDMSSMFKDNRLLINLDIASFNTSAVTNMNTMFNGCNVLEKIYVTEDFVTTNVTSSTNMFTGSTSIVGMYGTTYDSNHIDSAYAHIDGGTPNPGYLSRKGAIPVTFYYNLNTTAGSISIVELNTYCVPSSGNTSCTATVPTEVSTSVGKYNSAYKGVANSPSSLSQASLTVSSATQFYAFYQTPVTRYYYSSGYKTNTIYRNEYFVSTSEISTVLATNEEGTSNYTSSRGPGSSDWLGLSTAQDTTVEYNTVQAAANSTSTTLYTVYEFTINYEKSVNVTDIGATTATCKVTTSDTTCSVILPTITPNTGYVSVGWSETNGATTGDAPLTLYMITNNNRTLYANAKIFYYQNINTGTYYDTLGDAFGAVANNQTIIVLRDATESSDVTLADTKSGIILDLNGNTITMDSHSIMVNGILDIYNSSSTDGKIQGGNQYILDAIGTLTINETSNINKVIIDKNTNVNYNGAVVCATSGSLKINSNVEIKSNDGSSGIYNNGTAIVTGVIITDSKNGIYNYGTVTMTDGTITTSGTAIVNRGSGQVNISGNSTQITGTYGIDNVSTVVITGGTITALNGSGISNSSNANAQVSISGNNTQITGATYGINNNGTLTITGGTITGATYGIDNNGTATITGGTITGAERGIYNRTSKTVTLGIDDLNVSTLSPIIQATNSSNSYGVYNSSGIFNFYDGIIKSSSGTGKSIYGNVINKADDYLIEKTTTNGIETAILRLQIHNYQNTTTNKYYEILNDAFAAVENNQTIKVLQDVTETTSATLSGSKTGIKLDLNGKTITTSRFIGNNGADGSLDIYNTSNTEGTIQSEGSVVLSNYGTLTLNGTSSTNKVTIIKTKNDTVQSAISSNNSLTINNNVEVIVSAGSSSGIHSSGTLTVNGGTITGTGVGISNTGTMTISAGSINGVNSAIRNNGTATITGGTITGTTNGINNQSTGQMNISGNATQIIGNYGIENHGTITITDGTITGRNNAGIENTKTLIVSGGNITGSYGINNSQTAGIATITGGNITGTSFGIYNQNPSEVNISGSSTQITGPTGIYNNGILTISEGIITGTNNSGVSNNGTATITGGTISAPNTGINNLSGKTLTLGIDDSTVSTSIPNIQVTSALNAYGIYNNGGTFNFYDGIIKSASGTGYAIYGTVSNTPNGYVVKNETVSGIESATLAIIRTATFYYNTNTTAGSVTVATQTVSCEAAADSTSCDVTIPTEVTNSVGKYNSPYVGVSNATSSMTTGSLSLSENTNFYAIYSQNVTNYYYNSSYTSRTLYRNEYFISNTAMNTILSDSATGTENYVGETGPGSSAWAGLSTAADITSEYSTAGLAANSTETTLYTIYEHSISYLIGVNVSSIGANSGSCQMVSSDTTCGVLLPTITPDTDAVSLGWSTTSGTVSGTPELSLYMLIDSTTTLYANAIIANYQNTTTNAVYEKLNNAFSEVANNQTIKVLKDTTETTQATLASTKTGIKLDLNGKTVTMSNTYIDNSGALDIYNTSNTTGTINGGVRQVIYNQGTLTLNGTSSTNKIIIDKTSNNNSNPCGAIRNDSSSLTINTNAEVKVSTGSSPGIKNTGGVLHSGATVTINGGTISGTTFGIDSGTIIINSGTISGSTDGIYNVGIATITGGIISGSTYGISNEESAELRISGNSTQITGTTTAGILNYGNIILNSGTITGPTYGLFNKGDATINGGTITGQEYGLYNAFYNPTISGNSTILGGTIRGGKDAIYSEINSIITLGAKDSNVSTSSPLVQTTSTSNGYGVYNESSVTFNFYDGIIKSSSGTGYSINGTVSDKPSGYYVTKTTSNGIESAILTN